MIDLVALAGMIASILSGIGLLAVIISAAVAWLKQLGLKGKALTISAFILGVIIAVAVRFAMLPMVTVADWIWAAIFGLVGGLTATGAYKTVENATAAKVVKAQAQPEVSPSDSTDSNDDMDQQLNRLFPDERT